MLNEALKLVRIFHNISQSDLAKQIGISRSYLSELESGKKTPSIDLLNKYSDVFDIPPSSLLLFSEDLKNETFAEKSRVKVAKKITNIMNWLVESGVAKNGKHTKQV